jgi:hypothetical protein
MILQNGGVGTSSSSFNLFGTGGAGGISNGVNNNQVGVANPGLGGLANNGGLTMDPSVAAGESGHQCGQ